MRAIFIRAKKEFSVCVLNKNHVLGPKACSQSHYVDSFPVRGHKTGPHEVNYLFSG